MSRKELEGIIKKLLGIEYELDDRKRLIFWYDKKIPDYFSVAGAP